MSTPLQDPIATISTGSSNQATPENTTQSTSISADAQSPANTEPNDPVPVTALPSNFFSLVLPPSDPKQLSSQPAIQPPTQSHVPDALPDAGKQIPSTPQNPSQLHSSAPNPIAHPLDQLSQPPVSVPDLLPETQPTSLPLSFTIVPAPLVSSSGNVSEKKSSNTSNNTFLTANSVNPLAANALPQPQTAGGAVANAPQIGASSDAPDSLQRKGTTLVSAQSTNLPTATPQSAAIVLAGSTVQTSVQTSVQATPSDLIAPASAHKSDGSTPPGSSRHAHEASVRRRLSDQSPSPDPSRWRKWSAKRPNRKCESE